MITFFVPGIPAPAGSKKAFVLKRGGMYTGRAIVTDDCKRSKPWQSDIKAVANSILPMNRALLTGALRVTFEFCVHRPAGHYGSGKNAEVVKASSPRFPIVKPDVLKLARAAEDALTNIVWNDDAQIVEEHLFKNYVARTAQSGVKITIEEIEPEPPTISGVEAAQRFGDAYAQVTLEER